MSDLNQCTFTGRLGRDPESKRTQDGRLIVNLALAVSNQWRDKDSGERKERTTWVPVVVFSEGLAKICEQYLKKGSRILVQGELQVRKWTDKDGNERTATEVVLQGYSCTLTMLDGAKSDRQMTVGEAGKVNDRARDNGPDKAKYRAAVDDWSMRSGDGTAPARGKQAVEWDAKAADLDDEIPF